jgi:uncharacterized iron-regulated membrane protein
MNKRQVHLFVRRSHRYLGLIFGIQFLFWTVGGVYFSWADISHIRGDNIRSEAPVLYIDSSFTSPAEAIGRIRQSETVVSVKSVQLATILDSVYYQVIFNNGKVQKTRLVHAGSGGVREPLTAEEAVEVAKRSLLHPEEPVKIEYLTQTNNHHEYRENPLPVFAIHFKGSLNTTVYVAAEPGTVQKFRNTSWRIFDFLWMLHTMDYAERDNINNWALRIFSILGLVTLFSGFALFFVSFRRPKIS